MPAKKKHSSFKDAFAEYVCVLTPGAAEKIAEFFVGRMHAC